MMKTDVYIGNTSQEIKDVFQMNWKWYDYVYLSKEVKENLKLHLKGS